MQIKKLLGNEEEIKAFLDSIKNTKVISIDIEFMRRNTFFPEPCVIQISNGENHACIDLMLHIDFKNIFKDIFNEEKIIVLHSCRQDLEILYMILGYIPKNIFDTQFAASFLGFKYQIGYAGLMNEVYQIEIDKTEKMTNWKKRPLTSEQIDYALNDVIYLNKLHEELSKQLTISGKIDYFNEEFENFISDIEWEPKTEMAWKRIKTINNLDEGEKSVVKLISVWREEKAINLNLPRNWILSEKEIIEISKQFLNSRKISLPSTNKILDIKKDSDEIERIINSSTLNDKNDKKLNKKLRFDGEYKKASDELYEYYKFISIKNNISYQILSPKRLILTYLRNKDHESRLVNGWRKELVDMKKIENITKSIFSTN